MSTISVRKPVSQMLKELERDLNRDDLVFVERMPQIKESERYRDMVLSMFREFHIALVLIRMVFRGGETRAYVFLVRGVGESGVPTGGVVDGYVLVREANGKVTKYIYDSEEAPMDYLSREVLEFADLYRRAEERVIEHGLAEAYRDRGFFGSWLG